MKAEQREVWAGVDLGGTKVRAVIADATGAVLAEDVRATHPAGGRAVAGQIVDLVEGLVEEAGSASGARLAAVGLAVPGVVDGTTGALDRSPNVDGLAGWDLAGAVRGALGRPVALDNDANVAALGELHHGIGRQVDHFALVALGTGVGMGLVLDRRLVRGAGGAAGEIGYLPLGADPFDPAHHDCGAAEVALAGTSIAGRYHRATGRVRSTEWVVDHCGTDLRAAAALDDWARVLALVLQAVRAVADPGHFVLGGGLGSRPEVIDALRPHLKALSTVPPPVTTCELGPRGAALGAVHLAMGAAAPGKARP